MHARFARWLRALLIGVLCAGAGARAAAPSLFDIADPWLDETGRQVLLQQWRGKRVVVAMEYSECRFVCSVYWRRLQQVQAEADKRGLDLQFVILSIDPERDTPQGWREYRKARNLARTNWHFLTGSRATTNKAASFLGVRWWIYDGHLMHDFKIVRLDDKGGIGAAMIDFDQPLDLLLAR